MKQLFYRIGRDESCDLRLYNDLTSREHATLRTGKKGMYFIMDHSTNGTYINGIRLQSDVEYLVKYGTTVDFAHVEELNWSLIPKKKSPWKAVVIIIVSLVLLSGLAFAGYYFSQNYSVTRKPDVVPESIVCPADTIETASTPTPTQAVSPAPAKTSKPAVKSEKTTPAVKNTTPKATKDTPTEKKTDVAPVEAAPVEETIEITNPLI